MVTVYDNEKDAEEAIQNEVFFICFAQMVKWSNKIQCDAGIKLLFKNKAKHNHESLDRVALPILCDVKEEINKLLKSKLKPKAIHRYLFNS